MGAVGQIERLHRFFSCQSCHTETGKRIRASTLPNIHEPAEWSKAISWPAERAGQQNVRSTEHRLRGCLWQMRHPGIIAGSDASGIVWAVGDKVKRWKVGDEVVIHCNQDDGDDEECNGGDPMYSPSQRIWGYETPDGSFSQFTRVQSQQLMPRPKHLTWEESACYTLTLATAYRMLFGHHPHELKPGQNVLVWGASGGLEYEAAWALGSDTGVDDLDALTYANFLCNEDGFDPISFGATVAAAMELYEVGAITPTDTDGLELRFGNGEALIAMTQQIAERGRFSQWERFGQVLAGDGGGLAGGSVPGGVRSPAGRRRWSGAPAG